jgi:hypothetical protein
MYIPESYKLELHWNSIDKNKDDSCNLIGAYFCGPVLKSAEKINSSDRIKLDFTPQYSLILSSFYFVDCMWGNVNYYNEIVKLQDVTLKGDFVNKISNLINTDYIVIDTSKHDGESHLYNLVYKAAVLNKNGEENT